MHLHIHLEIIRIMNFTDSCGRVCKITELDSSSPNNIDIHVFIVVDDKTFPFIVPKSTRNVNITCGITTADCCSKYHLAHLHIFDKIYRFPVR